MPILLADSASPVATTAPDVLRLVQFVAPHYEAGRPSVLAEFTTAERKIAQDGGPQLAPAERERGNIRLDVPWAGEVPTFDRHGNARLSFTLRILAGDAVADADRIVAAILTAPARSAIEWRRGGQPTYFPLRGDAEWTPSYSMSARRQGAGMTVEVRCEVAPWAHRGSMDIADDFTADSIGDYTFDAGAGTLGVTNGELLPADNTEKRLHHSARGYTYGDMQITVRHRVGAAPVGYAVGLTKRLSATVYLRALLTRESTQWTMYLQRVDGVTITTWASAVVAAPAAATDYWLRFRTEGATLTAEHWATAPTPMAAPTTSVFATLTGADATSYGSGIVGQPGIVMSTASTGRVDDLRVQPFTYRSLVLPQHIAMSGPIPGDLPALCDLHVTPFGGTTAPPWGLFGWWRRAAAGFAPVGIFEGETVFGSSGGFAVTTGAAGEARGGSYLGSTVAAPAAASAWWDIDSNLLDADDDGSLSVEVFARVYGAGTWVLWADPVSGTAFGARRYGDRGSAGFAPTNTTGAWQFIRLGRIRLGGAHRLGFTVTYNVASVRLDYLLMVSARSFAASPIGTLLDSAYPRFAPSIQELTRVLHHDGSSALGPASTRPMQEHGLGRRIELPTGNVDLIGKLSSQVANRLETDASAEQLSHQATVHAAVLPRYAYA
jgi:hypothetical protein